MADITQHVPPRGFASRAYIVAATLFGVLGMAAFARAVQKPKFDEIDVQRIVLDDRQELEVERKRLASPDGDAGRKSDHEIVGDRGRRAVRARRERQNESDVTA